ncbi:RagB/SusD family nutrient uptake outer membrane protein [Sunxiuqinia sp. sy24]|uniref:RagB/SusD family nutrient uptake outer membrane protein n=1 Tax=Sunxiuqinia sp. sy24 TaxID=3461495 RepID=UPI0040452A13
MKRIKILLFILMTGAISSCDYLDVVPDNIATIDNAFTNRYNAEKYLATCYSFLPNFASYNSNPTIVGGDELWLPDHQRELNGPAMARHNQTVTSPRFDYWVGANGGKNLYAGIRVCNILLERIDEVPDLTEDESVRWKAEVKFLKAYYHFYLIRMYGPIHISDESIAVSASTASTKVYRDPVEDCFNYVLSLLDEAILDLPDNIDKQKTELGRISKPIAAAIKARVAITYASPLFNGNPDFTGLVDQAGTPLFPSEYDDTRWQFAADACKEAIDFAEQAGFSLYQVDNFITPYALSDTTKMKMALRSRFTERWNNEVIWATATSIVGGGRGGLQSGSQPRLFALNENPVTSNFAVPFKVAEQYYSNNGVPINEDKIFNYSDRYKLKISQYKDRKFIKQGEETAIVNFDREFRYYADLAFDRSVWFGNGVYDDESKAWWIKCRKGEPAAVYDANDRNESGYFPRKLINVETEFNADGTQYHTENYPFPIVRLSDLYLYYAEALNEVNEAPTTEVYNAIDQVRERAGLNGVVESWANFSKYPNKPLSKEGMREIIQQERLIELSFEGGRFWDLRRWKLCYEYLNQPLQGWSVGEKEIQAYYQVNTYFVQEFTVRDYFWPIREEQIILNPNLEQNTGW